MRNVAIAYLDEVDAPLSSPYEGSRVDDCEEKRYRSPKINRANRIMVRYDPPARRRKDTDFMLCFILHKVRLVSDAISLRSFRRVKPACVMSLYLGVE